MLHCAIELKNLTFTQSVSHKPPLTHSHYSIIQNSKTLALSHSSLPLAHALSQPMAPQTASLGRCSALSSKCPEAQNAVELRQLQLYTKGRRMVLLAARRVSRKRALEISALSRTWATLVWAWTGVESVRLRTSFVWSCAAAN